MRQQSLWNHAFRARLGTLSLVFLLTVNLHAQLNKGTLTGVIADPAGAAVSSAKIVAVHTDTNTVNETTATYTGNYTLPALDPGAYRVEIQASGFKKAVRDGVTITSGATVRLAVAMELGSVNESIEVSAHASAIETDTARVATNLTTKLVEDLPLVVNGTIRSVYDLVNVVPEATSSSGLRLAGGQSTGWDMTMDGSSTASASVGYQYDRGRLGSVPVDAISEFTVETSGGKAESGRAMGLISFSTKAGANQIHGSGFEYLRNNASDARGFFAQSAPVLKQSDFGGTFGGPVYIPKVYSGRNKTFFFGSYEGFRNRAGNNPVYYTIPLPEMYNGDFHNWTKSGKMVQLYDPASTAPAASGSGYTRTPFPGNLIPTTSFSTVAKNYLAIRPASMVPNVAGPTLNYFRSVGTAYNPWDKGTVRVDHQVNPFDHIYFMLIRGHWDTTWLDPNNPPGLPLPLNGSTVTFLEQGSYRGSWDHTINARVVNNLQLAYMRESGWIADMQQTFNPDTHWAQKLGVLNTPGPDRGLPPLSFSGYTGWGASTWGGDRGRVFDVSDAVTFSKGAHTFKAGFGYTWDQWWGVGQHRPNGNFGFSYLATAIPGDQSQNTGNGFASFLLGYVDSSGLETPRAEVFTWKYISSFFQDDWKVSNKLTLNLGVRWEYTLPVTGGALQGLKDWTQTSGVPANGFSNFDPSVPNPAAGGILGALVFSGSGTGRTGRDTMFNGYKKAWSPRVGLAWQPRNGTVIRASGGKSYGAVKNQGGSTHFDGLILNTTFSSQDLDITNFPTMLDKGLPPWTAPPFISPSYDNNTSISYWQPQDSGRPSELYTWSVDIQRQLPKNASLSAGYNGQRGVHLTSSILNVDQVNSKYLSQYGNSLLLSSITSAGARAAGIPIPYAGFSSSVYQALRPYPQYTSVSTSGGGEKAGNSNYQAMVIKVDKRYSSGLTLLVSYVLAKFFADGGAAMDQYNRRLDKALSGDDQTHVVRTAFSYELPFGKGRHFALRSIADGVLGGWSVAGFLDYESGTPLSVSPGTNPLPTAGNRVFISSYDNWRAPTSGNKFDPFADVWWNKASFQQVSASVLSSSFGNATRNNPKARTMPLKSENVSLSKSFSITERVKANLRFEGFNVFNRVRFASPDSSFTSSTFGVIRSQSNSPRQMQGAFKLTF